KILLGSEQLQLPLFFNVLLAILT
ncbi:hypothetical protein EVA_19427, partial [gut metagenome]